MSNPPPRLDDPGVVQLRRKREEFEARVRKNEKLAAANPAGYRNRVKALVAVGYAYIGLMLLLALGLVVGIVATMIRGDHVNSGGIRLIFFGLVMLYAIVRSLWVKIDKPEGFELTRERFPRLWQEVDAVADQLKAPRPHQILLDEEFNASATQWPRYGIFGGYRQVLTLGLPLLAGFAPDQAKGVIAHEFGHFSGSHGRFGVWIYRINQTWNQLAQNLSHSGYAGLLFRPFMNWFFPRFRATSFAIRRLHEYEADAAAVEVVGASTYAQTLSCLGPLGDHLERAFWANFRSESTQLGAMAPAFSQRMVASMRDPIDPLAAQRRLDYLLAQATDYDDTHPSLADRLRAIGQPTPTIPPPSGGPSAAEFLLGSELSKVEQEFDIYYKNQMVKLWQSLAEQKAKREGRLRQLEEKAGRSEDEEIEMAYLQTEVRPGIEKVATFRTLLEKFPESLQVQYYLGSALLEKEDEEGVALLERVAQQVPNRRDVIRRELAGFYARQGESKRVAAIREEARDAYDRAQVAQSNAALALTDELYLAELTPEQREVFVKLLGQLKGLARAYLFRKRMVATGELRHYLVVVPKPTTIIGDDVVAYFIRQFKKIGEPPIRVQVTGIPKTKPWKERLENLPGALIFDAKV